MSIAFQTSSQLAKPYSWNVQASTYRKGSMPPSANNSNATAARPRLVCSRALKGRLVFSSCRNRLFSNNSSAYEAHGLLNQRGSIDIRGAS